MNPTPPVEARRLPPSAVLLLVANAAPLVGVLLHHWTVFAVVLLYWSENVIVGGFNVLRMLFAQPQQGLAWAMKGFLIPFFCIHYGMFTFVHGVFVFALFGGHLPQNGFGLSLAVVFAAIKEQHLAYAVVALVLSHGFSFFHNYVAGGEYQRINLQQLMAQPYGRVVVLHLVVLGGGWVTLALGSPVGALVLLVVLKTGFDLRAHLAERRKLSSTPVLPLASPPGAPA